MNKEGCEYCETFKPLITWESGQAYIVRISEGQTVDLNTGMSMPPKVKKCNAIDITCSKCEKRDLIRINYCPMCGRKLKED